jgi:hypothetical protein
MSQSLSPTVMLATSMHAQPGVYAVLLGSGVSTGAGVLTGWGIVRELVRRVAVASNPKDVDSHRLAQDDPETWWNEHSQGDLGYSALLEALAPSPSARQGLLAEFFEPRDEDREEGIKVPSKAHLAIAQLAKRGFVRVIVTTNFDRLMEQALDSVGVAAQVITRPEAVNGMAPLAHSVVTLVKLHGDYKDLGSRNTPDELSSYPPEWVALLTQIFDEYGLVVCGWSAEWDTALVSAIESASNRRYPLYWDSRSGKGDTAQRIVKFRQGTVIDTSGADDLFSDLLASVDALERLSEPPITTAMALARLKRYLVDPVRRIDLHDLVMGHADALAERIGDQVLTVPRLDGAGIQAIWESHLRDSTPLVQILITGIWHDRDGVHDQLWLDALQRLIDAGTAPISTVSSGLDDARLWPALIAMTASGVACVRRDRERLIIRMARDLRGRAQMGTSDPRPASYLLHSNRLLPDEWVNLMPRWTGGRWLYPASHILKADLREFFAALIPLQTDYERVFHGYEYRLGLLQEAIPGGYRAASGEYVGERGWSWSEGGVPIAEEQFRDDGSRSRDWPWAEFLGRDIDGALVEHREVLKRYQRYG